MDLKARQKLLKAVPKFEDLIPEAVTRDPAKVTKKFREKEALTIVTKTLPKMHKQVMDIYRMVLFMHMQVMQAYDDEEFEVSSKDWMQSILNVMGEMCLDNVAHIYNEQRNITSRQLGYSTISDMNDMDDDTETLFTEEDIKLIRTQQNFQWDVDRILKRERGRKFRSQGRNRNSGRNFGGFGRPWRQNFYRNDRQNNNNFYQGSNGNYRKNNQFSRHSGSKRGRGRGF